MEELAIRSSVVSLVGINLLDLIFGMRAGSDTIGGDLRVSHPRRLWDWHLHQEERDSVPGAVLEELRSPSAVLTDDFLAGSDDRMADGRKKKKGFHDSIGLDWNVRSQIFLTFGSLPLDQIGDKLWDIRTGEKGS